MSRPNGAACGGRLYQGSWIGSVASDAPASGRTVSRQIGADRQQLMLYEHDTLMVAEASRDVPREGGEGLRGGYRGEG